MMEAEYAARVAELERSLAEEQAARELAVHKLLTCGIAASHPDKDLSRRGVYSRAWDSPQAEEVRAVRDRAERAERERDGAKGELSEMCGGCEADQLLDEARAEVERLRRALEKRTDILDALEPLRAVLFPTAEIESDGHIRACGNGGDDPEDWCAANCPESTPVCDGAPCAAPASPSVDILAIDLPQGPMPPREALGPAAPDDVLSPCPQNFSALGRLLALGQKAPPDPDAEPAEPPPLNIVARAAHLLAGKGPKEPVCVCGHPHDEDGLCHASFDDERSYLPVKCGCTTFRPAPGKEPKP